MNIEIFTAPRRGGKTYRAVLESARTGHTIVCTDKEEAARIHRWAMENNMVIPPPVPFEHLLRGRAYTAGMRGFIIDNADILLQQMCEWKLSLITINGERHVCQPQATLRESTFRSPTTSRARKPSRKKTSKKT